MNPRTLLALFLCLVVLQLWLIFVAEEPDPAIEELVTEEAAQPEPALPEDPPELPDPPDVDIPEERIAFDYCQVTTTVTTAGGYLQDAELTDLFHDYDIEPLWQWAIGGFRGRWVPYGEPERQAMALTPAARFMGMGSGTLNAAVVPMAVVDRADDELTLRGTTGDGIEVTRRLWVDPDCVLHVEATWHNPGEEAFQGPLWLSAHDVMPEESGWYAHATRPWAKVDDRVEDYTSIDRLIEPELYPGPVSWFGVMSNYFAALVLPGEESRGELYFSPSEVTDDETQYGQHYVVADVLHPGARITEQYRVFIGPKELERLNAVDPALGDAVQLGWFGFFGHILLWMLKLFYSWVGNWGLAIIALTFVVKMLFFPLTQMSFKSSQAMQAIQPKLQELRELYKDDPQEMNQKTIQLFRENKVNPLGGCLPMLVQLPVWIALYQVLLSSVEIYQTHFLYLRDLSSADPYLVMPVVVVVLMMIQQRMMPLGNLDPTQQRIMRFLPLVFGIFFFAFPSGLVLYIFVNMVLTIAQQWYIKRTYRVPEPSAASS